MVARAAAEQGGEEIISEKTIAPILLQMVLHLYKKSPTSNGPGSKKQISHLSRETEEERAGLRRIRAPRKTSTTSFPHLPLHARSRAAKRRKG